MSFSGSNFFKIVCSGRDYLDVFFQGNIFYFTGWTAGDHYSYLMRADPLGHSHYTPGDGRAGCLLGENSCFLGFASQWQFFALRSYSCRVTMSMRSVEDVDGGEPGGVADDSRVFLLARMQRTHPYYQLGLVPQVIRTDPGSVVDFSRSSDSFPSVYLSVRPVTFQERYQSWLKCTFFERGGSQVDFARGKVVPFSPCFDFCLYSDDTPYYDWDANRGAYWHLTYGALVRFRAARAIGVYLVPGDEPERESKDKRAPDEEETEDGGPGAEPPEIFSGFKIDPDVK